MLRAQDDTYNIMDIREKFKTRHSLKLNKQTTNL